MMSKICIYSHTEEAFASEIFSRLGKGKRHAALLYRSWMRQGSWESIPQMEPQALALAASIKEITGTELFSLKVKKEEEGTCKCIFKLHDGYEIESVAIPMKTKMTLCVSSQVGCKKACAFCETGKMGLLRDLSSAEIVMQFFYVKRVLGLPVQNIVFMGMGEPFDNYEAVLSAIHILMSAFGMGPGQITISTSGHVPHLLKFTEEAPRGVKLAVSVNAPHDEIRKKIMPVTRKWNMQALKEAMLYYCSRTGKEILAEYVLLKDVNDSPDAAGQLADYLKGLEVKVNVIPYNPQSSGHYLPPEQEAVEAFVNALRQRGLQVLLRKTKGDKIMAACGQLGNLSL